MYLSASFSYQFIVNIKNLNLDYQTQYILTIWKLINEEPTIYPVSKEIDSVWKDIQMPKQNNCSVFVSRIL